MWWHHVLRAAFWWNLQFVYFEINWVFIISLPAVITQVSASIAWIRCASGTLKVRGPLARKKSSSPLRAERWKWRSHFWVKKCCGHNNGRMDRQPRTSLLEVSMVWSRLSCFHASWIKFCKKQLCESGMLTKQEKFIKLDSKWCDDIYMKYKAPGWSRAFIRIDIIKHLSETMDNGFSLWK